jgi:Family of unknown function (DUF6714)
MNKKDEVLHKIRTVFGSNEYPGDGFLQGSTEGCEPYDEVGPFQGRTDWESIEPSFLDAHAGALSFFSEAGLRFFLPAFLIADIQEELKTADPLISLTYGFSDLEVRVTINNREFVVRNGKSELLNPRRYGASTFLDYVRFRLSIFTREEAQAIVAYLEYRRDADARSPDRARIDAALNEYWRQRATNAPAAESLRRHLKEKDEFVAATNAAKRSQ